MNVLQLPVPVLEHPHWRVVIRPTTFTEERIQSRAECKALIAKCKVGFRGWDYPHIPRDGVQIGSNWIEASSPWLAHLEYWRLYQSAQFVHLLGVRESTDERWAPELKQATESHLRHLNKNWNDIPGFLSITNVIYTTTEIFELASRLCQALKLSETVTISITLRRIKGFVLTADWNRSWTDYYAAAQDEVGHTWNCDSVDLASQSRELATRAAIWIFESFGWTNPSRDVIAADQATLIRGG